jgi:hypothetical protein
MQPGTLFIWLFFGLAPLFALLLLWRIGGRFVREPRHRVTVIVWGAVGLALWSGATYAMLFLAFATAYGLAHTEPLPGGPFPEGWLIYAFLAAYAAFGTGLLVAAGKISRKSPAD